MSGSPKHRLAAGFQIVFGVAIIGWWAVAAATNGIVELNEGRTDIVFHVTGQPRAGTAATGYGRTP